MDERKFTESKESTARAEPPTPARIIQIATAGWEMAILATAVRYSIFTHVERGADSRDAIARRAGISLRGAAAILDGLVGLGLLELFDGRYRNAADAAAFLVEGSPSFFGGYPSLMFSTYSDWLELPEVARDGKPLADVPSEMPESRFWEELVPAIMVLSVPVVLAAARRLRIQDSGAISILDVGGGSGVYSAFWLEMNPRARSTQIDWANVNRIARGVVGRRGAADRFRTIDGDFHEVEFGTAEYDVAIYSHIAHMESPASNRAIFRKFRTALKPGGTLVVSDFVVENDRSGPPFPLLFASEMLVRTREGSTWSRADYESWLRDAGFRAVEFQATPSPATLVFAS